jgi:hypothetical protein
VIDSDDIRLFGPQILELQHFGALFRIEFDLSKKPRLTIPVSAESILLITGFQACISTYFPVLRNSAFSNKICSSLNILDLNGFMDHYSASWKFSIDRISALKKLANATNLR